MYEELDQGQNSDMSFILHCEVWTVAMGYYDWLTIALKSQLNCVLSATYLQFEISCLHGNSAIEDYMQTVNILIHIQFLKIFTKLNILTHRIPNSQGNTGCILWLTVLMKWLLPCMGLPTSPAEGNPNDHCVPITHTLYYPPLLPSVNNTIYGSPIG